MSRVNYRVWVADFETTTEEWAIAKGYTEVWAYALTEVHANSAKQNCMDECAVVYTNYRRDGDPFDLFLEDLLLHCDSGDKVYFHNLKFDGQFLLSGLMARGFKDITNEQNADTEYKKMYDETFSVLIAGSSWYSIKVEFGGKRIEFRDSLKRIPMTVKRMAKEYKLPILKGDIDYKRDPSLPMTRKEWQYIRHDVLIPAEVLRQQYQEGFTQLTTAGYAFAEYKKWLKANGHDFNDLFPTLDPITEAFVRRSYDGGEVYVNPRFQDRVIGEPKSPEIIGHTWDINSMYPAKMSAAPMPYGQSETVSAYDLELHTLRQWRDWRGDSKRYFIEIKRCVATLRAGRIPSIGICTGFGVRDYPEQVDLVSVVMTDIRFEMLLSDYDIDYLDLGQLVWFKARLDLFFNYMQAIVAEKNQASIEGNIMRKAMAKVKMNSLYGKFGQKSKSRGAFFTWDEEVGLVSNGYTSECGSKYIPIASVITAESRHLLVSQANKFGSAAVAYMDTDSIHVIDAYHTVKEYRRRKLPRGDKAVKTKQMHEVLSQEELIGKLREFEYARKREVWCDEFDLGAFKIEGEFSCGKWLRAKTYFEAVPATMEEVKEHFISVQTENWNGEDYVIPEKSVNPGYYLIGQIKGAGITDAMKMEITVENFNVGLVLQGKLLPKKFKGGVVLHETTYEIKEQYTVQKNNREA